MREGITIHISFGPEIEALLPMVKQILENLPGPISLCNDLSDKPDEVLTPDDLACLWKVPKSKIYALTMQTGPGSIPRFKIGRDLRFKRSKIERWAEEQGNSAQQPLGVNG